MTAPVPWAARLPRSPLWQTRGRSLPLFLLLTLALLLRPGAAVRALSAHPPSQWIHNNSLVTVGTAAVGEPVDETVTLIGYGSLLSETSARMTFPTLTGFRLGRVFGYRRVFQHPSGIFFRRGVVPEGTLEMAALSVEPCDGCSIVVAVMEIPRKSMEGLLKREEEYDFVTTPFHEMDAAKGDTPLGRGIICVPMERDEDFFARWGPEVFERSYGQYGIEKIWGWGTESGILPCPVYLRHCVLAARKAGEVAIKSFLDDSFLVDRRTSIRKYLERRPMIMETEPPAKLVGRYSG